MSAPGCRQELRTLADEPECPCGTLMASSTIKFGCDAVSERVVLRLRIEDAVALVFFLLMLAARLLSRELRHEMVSPADVLIVIPAITLLLAKELVQYFLPGTKRTSSAEPACDGSPPHHERTESPLASLWQFARP